MEEIKKFKTLVDEEKMLDAFYPEHKKIIIHHYYIMQLILVEWLD